MSTTTTLFRNPDAFFEGISSGRRLRREIIMLLLVGLVGAAGWAWLSSMFLDALSGDRAQLRILLVGKGVQTAVAPLAWWLFYAVTVHVAATALKSKGPLLPLFKTTAWAMTPITVTSVARSLGYYLAFQDETIPPDPEGFSQQEVFNSLWELGSGDPPMLAFLGGSAIMAVAIGYLLHVGLQHVRDLSAQQARLVVAIPVVVHVGYIAWKGLTYTGTL